MSQQPPTSATVHHAQQWLERIENLEKTEGWKEIILPFINTGMKNAQENILDPKNDDNHDLSLVEKGKYRALKDIIDFVERQKAQHRSTLGRSKP